MSGDGVEEDGLRSEGTPVRLLTLNRPDRRNALDGYLPGRQRSRPPLQQVFQFGYKRLHVLKVPID